MNVDDEWNKKKVCWRWEKSLVQKILLIKKEVIKAMSDIEITDDQREDILHVIDIVYDNNYYYINEYFENTYRYCIDKYITKR